MEPRPCMHWVGIPDTAWNSIGLARPCREEASWSLIWPSSVVMAGILEREGDQLNGMRILEIEPGLGLASSVAVRHGAKLTVIDPDEEAMDWCLGNIEDNNPGATVYSYITDFENPSESFLADLERNGGYDLVIASDVLYRDDLYPSLIVFLEITAKGEVITTTPPRPGVEIFLTMAQGRGWNIETERHSTHWPDPEDGSVDVISALFMNRSPS